VIAEKRTAQAQASGLPPPQRQHQSRLHEAHCMKRQPSTRSLGLRPACGRSVNRRG